MRSSFIVALLASGFWLLTPGALRAATHVTATYDLGSNPHVMTTAGGQPQYGLVFAQRNKTVTYNSVEYDPSVVKGYLNGSGQLNDGAASLWLDLIPNLGATPADGYYVVTFNIQGRVHAEIWIVPDIANVTADAVRQVQPPSSTSSGFDLSVATGLLALAHGGTGQSGWTAGRCVRVNSAGSALESTAADCGSGGGGGDNVSVNGTAAADADFDDSTPAAPSRGFNVHWQKDALSPNNLSAHLLTTDVGTTTFGSGSAFTWTFDASAGTDVTTRYGDNEREFSGNVGIGVNPGAKLDVAGVAANQYASQLTANATTGQSLGLRIYAGTNGNDYAFNVNNRAATAQYFIVRGDGLTQVTPNGSFDASGSGATSPVKAGTTAPGSCTANKDLFIDTDATPGQQLLICNATGNGWNLMGDGGGGGSAHAILSSTHSDTTTASAVRGDMIGAIGASPTWQRVAHSTSTGGYWKWNGTDVVASTGAASGTGACGANTWASTLNADAAPTCTQPATTNLSDSSAIVKNNQANVFTVAGGVAMDNQLGIRLRELTANGTNYIEHRAVADAGASNTTYTWPATTDSRFLFSGSSGALAWNQASGVGSCTNQAVTALNNNAAPTCTTITSAYTSGTFSATAHNLLSSTHGDTTAGTVARGDLITGQGASPTWQRLAKGTASQCLQMDGSATDIVWGSCAGAGGGDNISVNGTAATDADFDDATPAAEADYQNVKWQKDALSPNNISAEVPFAAASLAGTVSTTTQTFAGDKTFNNNVGIGGTPTHLFHIPNYLTTTSQAMIGSLEIQGFALNNSWLADNMYYNGTNFKHRATGAAVLFYFNGDEGQFRNYASATAGSNAALRANVKFNSAGDFGVGASINSTPGNFTGADLYFTGGTKVLKVNGVMNAVTGFQINSAATTDRCLLGNGTNFVQSGSDCLTTDNTKTLTNKTFDAEATGNALGTVSYIFLDAGGCQNTTAFSNFDLPTSGAAVAACNTGTNTQQGLLDFATDSGTLTAQRKFQLPADWNSSGAVEAMAKWKTSATANDVVWQVAIACVADAQTDDPSFTDTAFAADTAKGTANQQNDTAWTTITTTGGCAAGELAYLRLKRDPAHASDTLAAGTTARLIALSLRFRRTQ